MPIRRLSDTYSSAGNIASLEANLPAHYFRNTDFSVLRLSVTEHCNFRCTYCMPDDKSIGFSAKNMIPLDKIVEIVNWLCANFGVRKVKLTGGEPLIRKGIADLIGSLYSIHDIDEVSMTTNGSMLSKHAEALIKAGLNRINISLDTLDPLKFKELTRFGLDRTLSGIRSASEAGFSPIKLNSVLRESTWRTDVPQLLDFAAENNHEIRFIELMHTGTAIDWVMREFVSASIVKSYLKSITKVKEIERESSQPARQSVVFWNGKLVKTGWITPQSQSFCSDCNRLRLDSFGRLRRCLMDETTLPLAEIINDNSTVEAVDITRNYLKHKTIPTEMSTAYTMAAVGG